jgi:hypothetical protein
MLLFGQSPARDDLISELERVEALAADMTQILEGQLPEVMVRKTPPILERWFVGRRTVPCLIGFSTGHPALPGSNRPIITSDLWLLSEDYAWARTLSRWYRLGRPARKHDLHS